tara:strand:- start:1540 stop:2685 length:1146 start_codon:yes stop_codon:yes gene_type:complete
MIVRPLLIGVVSILLAAGCIHQTEPTTNVKHPNSIDFLKVAVHKLDPQLDEKKPIARANYGGWTQKASYLIGELNDSWVTLYDLESKSFLWWLKNRNGLSTQAFFDQDAAYLPFYDGTLVKVDIVSGKVIWQVSLDSFIASSIVKKDNRIFAVTTNQTLYALDQTTGMTFWAFDAGVPSIMNLRNQAAPIAVFDHLYFSTQAKFYCLNIEDGTLVWKQDVAIPNLVNSKFNDPVGQIGFTGTSLILAYANGNVISYSLEENTKHNFLWKHEGDFSSINTSFYSEGIFYIGTHEGWLYALDSTSGDVFWKKKFHFSVDMIFINGDKIIVNSNSGMISVLSVLDGKDLFYERLSGTVVTPPFAYKNSLYFSTGMGNLYQFQIR